MDTAKLIASRWFSIKDQLLNMEELTTTVNSNLNEYFSKMLEEDNGQENIDLDILNDARDELRTWILELKNALTSLENELNEDEEIFQPITNGALALKIHQTEQNGGMKNRNHKNSKKRNSKRRNSKRRNNKRRNSKIWN